MLFDLLLRSVAEEEQIDGEIWPPSGSCFLLSFHGAPESVGLVSCLQDVGAVGDTVEEGLAEAGVGEDRRPLRERQVGGDDDGGLLCPIGDDLEEHLGSDLGQGNVAHLIEGDQVPLLPSARARLSWLLWLASTSSLMRAATVVKRTRLFWRHASTQSAVIR